MSDVVVPRVCIVARPPVTVRRVSGEPFGAAAARDYLGWANWLAGRAAEEHRSALDLREKNMPLTARAAERSADYLATLARKCRRAAAIEAERDPESGEAGY